MTTTDPDAGSSTDHSAAPSAPGGANRWLYVLVATVLVALLGWLGWHWRQQQPPQRFRRALAALERNDASGIRRELNGWPSSMDFESHRHFLTGALLLHEHKPIPALEEFQWSAQHPELRVRSLTLTGGALYQLGQQPDAVRLLLQVVDEDPKAVDAHRWLGSAFYDLGLNQRALVHLAAVAELDSQDPRPHRLIGLMHKDFEHYPEAIAAYQESLRRSVRQPHVEEIRLELAECLIKQRQYDEALAQLKDSVDSPAKNILEAECVRASENPARAMELVDAALAVEPRNLKALTLKGTAFLEDGDAASAAVWLGQAVEHHPHDYPARFKYSQALQRSGKPDEAAVESKRATQTKKLYETFTAQHEQADQNPDDVTIRYELGLTALKLGRPDLAVNWFRMALALDPQHAAARQELQRLQDAARRERRPPPAAEKR